MPTQGSPNVPFVAGTEQLLKPTQAVLTSIVLVVALQLLIAKLPHAPLGVP